MLSEWIARITGFETTEEILYECRRCGTSVEEDTEFCPQCGASQIGQFRID